MMRNSISVVVTLIALGAGLAPEVHAQSWLYSPYTGQSTWMTFARSLTYPLNRFTGSSTPFYLANNLLWAGSYAADQHIRNRQRDYYYDQYYDQEPYGNPRQRNRWFNGYPGQNDQIVHTRPYSGYGQQSSYNNALAGASGYDNDWLGPAPVAPAASAYLSPSAVQGSTTHNAAIGSSYPFHQPSGGGPLSAGFIQVVNKKYDGDLSKALADKDTARYAAAVGLIDRGKSGAGTISSDKRNLIRSILADENESPEERINAVRVLLKH